MRGTISHTRRQLLTAAPAAGLATMMAGAMPVAASAETPVAALFREWIAAKADEEAAYRASPDDDAAHDAAWHARHEVEKRLMAAPCLTAHDWLLKVTAWSNYGEGDGPDAKCQPQLWAEARALTGGAA